MSIPLLKRSLELVDSNQNYGFKDNSKKSNVKETVAKLLKRRNNINDIRGVGDVKNCNISKLKQVKKKIKKTQKNLEHTLNTLKYLKRPCIDRAVANTILERNKKPTIEEYVPAPEPQGTVFTEEDFQKFEECLQNEG